VLGACRLVLIPIGLAGTGRVRLAGECTGATLCSVRTVAVAAALLCIMTQTLLGKRLL
jgi:hypothetical protein